MAEDPKTGGLGIPVESLNELADAFSTIAKIFRKIAAKQHAPGPQVGAGHPPK